MRTIYVYTVYSVNAPIERSYFSICVSFVDTECAKNKYVKYIERASFIPNGSRSFQQQLQFYFKKIKFITEYPFVMSIRFKNSICKLNLSSFFIWIYRLKRIWTPLKWWWVLFSTETRELLLDVAYDDTDIANSIEFGIELRSPSKIDIENQIKHGFIALSMMKLMKM